MKTLKERIEQLERRVRELEARPSMVAYPPPVFVPYVPLTYPAIQPVWPHPWPYPSTPIVTCEDRSGSITSTGLLWNASAHDSGRQQ